MVDPAARNGRVLHLVWRLWQALFIAIVGHAAAASAALIDRGNGLIYDTVLHITWVQNASLCVVLDNCINRDDTVVVGGMTWEDANTWAANLVYQGFDDWRLPYASVAAGVGPADTVVFCPTATEAECRDNELAYMFYHHLGGSFFQSSTGTQISVGGITFSDIQPGHWTGTQSSFIFPVLPPPPVLPGTVPSDAWVFFFQVGTHGAAPFSAPRAAWAVRSGDVLIAAVPKPPGGLVVAIGLVVLWCARKTLTRVPVTSGSERL